MPLASTRILPFDVSATLAGSAIWASASVAPSDKIVPAIAAAKICFMMEPPLISLGRAPKGTLGGELWGKGPPRHLPRLAGEGREGAHGATKSQRWKAGTLWAQGNRVKEFVTNG